jgi:hypothetical protein
LSESKICFVLSGAIYLNVSEQEHYYFKTFGDCHLIADPFLKMNVFFRIPEENINHSFTINYFKKAYFDTLEVLTAYKGYFYILPVHELSVEDPKKHFELLDGFFWAFISSICKSKFHSNAEFCNKYSNYEEIENDLTALARQHLIFSDISDSKLSLRERMKLVRIDQDNISSTIFDRSEAQSFLVSVFSYVAQVADILYMCLVLRINPYIRFNVTFNYLTLVMYTFIDDISLRELIEKALICYLFRRTVEEERFVAIGFPQYCKRLEEKSLMNAVLERIRNMGIDIFKENPSKAISVIHEEFDSIFEPPAADFQSFP